MKRRINVGLTAPSTIDIEELLDDMKDILRVILEMNIEEDD
jgi:hypothetical protein